MSSGDCFLLTCNGRSQELAFVPDVYIFMVYHFPVLDVWFWFSPEITVKLTLANHISTDGQEHQSYYKVLSKKTEMAGNG